MQRYALEFTAFVSGAAVMALEIVASRILSPYLGNSIVVWTSLIGVILFAMSMGYWNGGRLADRNPSPQTLASLLVVAAALTGFIALDKNPCLALAAGFPDLRMAALAADVVLFGPASFVLAMIAPYVVRLRVKEIGSSGETVGRLYAISTLGSIVGTFGAGFVLLALVGTTTILLSIAAILLLTSGFVYTAGLRGMRVMAAAFLVACGLGAPRTSAPFLPGTKVFETDTRYNHYLVYDTQDADSGRPIRSLFVDLFGRQSSVFRDHNDELVLEYTKYFRLAKHFRPNAKRCLLLGGGAYTYVRDFFLRNPESSLDVVELDPQLESIARRYFGLQHFTGLSVIAEDARTYLNRSRQKYDVVLVDTFAGTLVPFHMATREAVQRIYDTLEPDGVVVMNLRSAVTGKRGELFRAEFATYRSVFSHVEAFPLGFVAGNFQNIMLVGFKSSVEPKWTSSDSEIARYLSHRWIAPIQPDLPVLTDDFAPVEIYLLDALGS